MSDHDWVLIAVCGIVFVAALIVLADEIVRAGRKRQSAQSELAERRARWPKMNEPTHAGTRSARPLNQLAQREGIYVDD